MFTTLRTLAMHVRGRPETCTGGHYVAMSRMRGWSTGSFRVAADSETIHSVVSRATGYLDQQGFITIVRQLQRDSDRECHAGIAAIVKVVPVVITNVQVIGVVPVLCPGLRVGIHQQKRKTAIREARIPHIDGGEAVHSEPVFHPEIEIELGLRNVVTAIATTLGPGAMIAIPVLSTILLPCTMPLPAALLLPSPLLLPRDCLLPRTLRLLLLLALLGTLCLLLRPLLLSLLGLLLLRLLLMSLLSLLLLRLLLMSLLSLLLLRLLLMGLLGLLLLRLLLMSLLGLLLLRLLLMSLLGLLVLRLLLMSLLGLLLLLRLLGPFLLRALLLCGLLLWLCLFFVLFFMLRVRRDNHPEKQKQGSGTGSSNKLHSNRLLQGHH